MPPRSSVKLGSVKATYKVLSGKHHIKASRGGGITTYKAGTDKDTFESLTDPRINFPNKFELVAGKAPDDLMKDLIEEE